MVLDDRLRGFVSHVSLSWFVQCVKRADFFVSSVGIELVRTPALLAVGAWKMTVMGSGRDRADIAAANDLATPFIAPPSGSSIEWRVTLCAPLWTERTESLLPWLDRVCAKD